ncbi:FAD-dependent oxidoreductase (plasmid) [Ensifer sp. PDNC004]|uniref:FAD-dependent oxidoreductase n=1 Tax=Ensifer sp. PDNC004 TaxID=2811423 RepID=UPI0019648929|nr:FAD-dependent oxidoreductase [Ensifer sp. PDNC004]QRY64842.1 FAD-dependent oxidoreductase [Ensifer sp. PDNC004]
MTNDFAADVLICGAGAAGLSLAIDLARRGISFRLVDRVEAPFRGSRGKGIQPRTQEIFEDLGVLDKAVAAGGLYPRQRTYQDDGRYVDADMGEIIQPTPAEPYHLALMVPQFVTEQILRSRLAELGGRVEFGRELKGFEQDQGGVTARIAGGDCEEIVRVRWLIGADGGKSFVRRFLGTGFPGSTLDARAVVADVELSGLSREVAHRFARSGDMRLQVWIGPLAGTDLFQIQAPVARDEDVELTAEGLTRFVSERTGLSDIIVHAVHWASDYEMNARLADGYRTGRTFLIGDAAHVHPPTGGQGLNTSVQDAYNLGWKLSAVVRGAPDHLLDSYEAERRPVAAAMLGLANRLLDAQKQGEMRRGRDVRQLDIGYPESELSLNFTASQGALPAGARAPDAPMRGAGGQVTRLFELLKGPHWTLLAYEASRATFKSCPGLHIHRVGKDGEFHDEWQHFKDAYSLMPGDCLLIRPDGYIGAVFDTDRTDEIDGYLANVGLSSFQEDCQ